MIWSTGNDQKLAVKNATEEWKIYFENRENLVLFWWNVLTFQHQQMVYSFAIWVISNAIIMNGWINDPPISCFIGIVLVIIAVGNYILRVVILPRSFVFDRRIIQKQQLDPQESSQFTEICYLFAKLEVLLTDIHVLLSMIRSYKPEQYFIGLFISVIILGCIGSFIPVLLPLQLFVYFILAFPLLVHHKIVVIR